jgi:hypothetical protein
MICGSNSLLDHSIVPLCYRYMVELSISKVPLHIQIIHDLFQHAAIFNIAVYSCYHTSTVVVLPEDHVERSIIFVVLFGIHSNQTSKLDCPISGMLAAIHFRTWCPCIARYCDV